MGRAGTWVDAPLVRLRGVGMAYPGGTLALRDADLAVGRGEFLSLLGLSGCGKSTLLRIVAGLATPTAGQVERAPEIALAQGDVGFVFQDPTLMPWADVAGNVRLPLALKRVPRREAEARAAAMLERVGLAGFARAFPRELSGGMRMRVSIARALVTAPALLLMDEPFAALDEITRQHLNDELLRLWAGAGWTVVFVTHSVFESVYLSTRIAVMTARPGRIAEELPVPVAYPRGPEFRLSADYATLCRAVSAALARTMPAAVADAL